MHVLEMISDEDDERVCLQRDEPLGDSAAHRAILQELDDVASGMGSSRS